jgi:hypothetical protein
VDVTGQLAYQLSVFEVASQIKMTLGGAFLMAERGANFNFDPSILSNVLARDYCPTLYLFYSKWISKARILIV